jgi:integrase
VKPLKKYGGGGKMSVYRHHGKWKYDFLKDGRRMRKGGFNTKQEAVTAEAKARVNLKRISTDFIRLCEKRLEELDTKRTRKHFKENKALIERLILRWSDFKEITRDDVEDYLNSVARESHQKANKHLRLIKALFNHGVQRDWFDYNPAAKIQKFPVTPDKRYVPPEDDILKVLSLASEQDRLYLLVIAHTLGRITAVNQLKWEDIHEDHLSLYTRKARNSDLKEIRVPINAVLKDVLTKIPREGEYLFLNRDTGRPYGYRSKFLKTLCRNAKVKSFSYHSFRHFGASLLSKAGVGTTEIQKILGHERATTTDSYLRSLGDGAKEAVKKLEGLKVPPKSTPLDEI